MVSIFCYLTSETESRLSLFILRLVLSDILRLKSGLISSLVLPAMPRKALNLYFKSPPTLGSDLFSLTSSTVSVFSKHLSVSLAPSDLLSVPLILVCISTSIFFGRKYSLCISSVIFRLTSSTMIVYSFVNKWRLSGVLLMSAELEDSLMLIITRNLLKLFHSLYSSSIDFWSDLRKSTGRLFTYIYNIFRLMVVWVLLLPRSCFETHP